MSYMVNEISQIMVAISVQLFLFPFQQDEMKGFMTQRPIEPMVPFSKPKYHSESYGTKRIQEEIFLLRILFLMLYIVVMVDTGTVSGVKLGQGACSAQAADNRIILLDQKRKWNSLRAEDLKTVTAKRPLTSCTKCQKKKINKESQQ